MAKNALNASRDRFVDLMHRSCASLEDAYGDENGAIATKELQRRAASQHPRSVTVARREARVAKGQSRFVNGVIAQPPIDE